MKGHALALLLLLALARPAAATVSIEFQLGGITVPAGSVGVLVADTNADGFAAPDAPAGTLLEPGDTFGSDDVIVTVFAPSALVDAWDTQRGFADHVATIDYPSLGVSEGNPLALYILPDRAPGETVRAGEPHLIYRTEDLGDFTPNSTMGFALPRDGGAYLLAVLGSAQGGEADLAGIDLAPLPYQSGSGLLSRQITPTGRHTYFFQLSNPGFLSLEGIAPNGVRAELRGPDGQIVAESEGGAPLEVNEPLSPGFHTLVLFRTDGGSDPLAYEIAYADADGRLVTPDVAVGASLLALRGVGVLNGGPGQIAAILSRKARPVSGFATVANRGKLPNRIAVRGGRRNRFFAVSYLAPTGNISSAMFSGAYRSPLLASGNAAVPIRVAIKPNKKKLTKERNGRVVLLRKTFQVPIRATATNGSGAFDSGTIRVRTR